MNMNKREELKLVVDRAVKGLPWCGDLALQKMVYLLQSVYGVDMGYEFGYHHMGPYSFDLADDLSIGVLSGEWVRESKPIANGRYWVNQYQVTSEVPADGPLFQQVETALGKLLEQFKAQNDQADGRRFELVATIHYLREVQEVPEDELEGVLRALKPKYSKDEFQEGVRQLNLLKQSATEMANA
mgnify:CR=1 FL=1